MSRLRPSVAPLSRPPQPTSTAEIAVNSVHLFPQNQEQLVVCNRSSTVYIMTMQVRVCDSHGSLSLWAHVRTRQPCCLMMQVQACLPLSSVTFPLPLFIH